MITIRDNERSTARQVALNENDGRHRFPFPDPLQVLRDVWFVDRQQRKAGGAQDIFCGVFSSAAPACSCNETLRRRTPKLQRQVAHCAFELFIAGPRRPLRFMLCHGLH